MLSPTDARRPERRVRRGTGDPSGTRAKALRRAVGPLALVLALATGVVLAETRAIALGPIGTEDGPWRAETNAAAVRRFYDAVNRALESGETASLSRLVGEDFVEHAVRPGVAPDRDGLIRYLRVLHATAPALRLTVRDLFVGGDSVAALVRVDGANARSIPGLPAPVGRAWGTIDVFRLRSGRIVEHWGDDAGLGFVEPLLAVTIPVELRTNNDVDVDRRTYAAETAVWYTTGGPTILLVETGPLTVELGGTSADPATVVRATESSGRVRPGGAVTLGPGDALLLTAGSSYQARSEGGDPAVALTIWAANKTVVSGLGPADSRAANPSGQGWSPGTPAPAATPAAAARGVAVELPEGAAAVTIGRVALAPGASLARHRVANAELAVVETGRLELDVDDGSAWVRAMPGGEVTVEGDITLTAGDRVLLDGGTTVAYHNQSSEPLIVLLVTIGHGPDGGATAPADG